MRHVDKIADARSAFACRDLEVTAAEFVHAVRAGALVRCQRERAAAIPDSIGGANLVLNV